jgi:glutamate decarboxylase
MATTTHSTDFSKKRKASNVDGDGKTNMAAEMMRLQSEVESLREALTHSNNYETTLYASDMARDLHPMSMVNIPRHGMNPRHVKDLIESVHDIDNEPRLNTSSYVNVVHEPEEVDIATLGSTVNLADASVYPGSVAIHDKTVDWIAELWNCPKPAQHMKDPTVDRPVHYSGSGTVGSTEACLLAGLAHKFRWRKWYKKRHDMTALQVLGVRPNLVMSSCFQAAWEK